MQIQKFYPPIYINYISCKKDKTLVKVSFFEVDEEDMKKNIKKGENAGGIVKETQIIELEAGLTPEQAREQVYTKLKKDKKITSKTYERDTTT